MLEKTENEIIEEFDLKANAEFEKETKKEVAFVETNGRKIYQFTDGGLPIYYSRFHQMQQAVRKNEEWRITDGVLTEYLEMVLKYTNDQTLNPERRLAEVQRLTEMMNWRRQQSNDLMLVYEIASVWFFDESEDPAVYDYNYAQAKIKRWVQQKELFAFFLSIPLNRFISFQDLSEAGTKNYLKKMYETMYSHSMYNFSRLSESEKQSSMGQNIISLMEIYLGLTESIDLE